MKIIIINGSGGSGKSTFVKFAKESKVNVLEFSMVDYIKKLAYKIGWDGNKDDKGRRLLSDLKDALDRYDDVSFNSVLDQILLMADDIDETNTIVFIHAREPKDIERWVKEKKATTLLIRRPGVEKFSNHADREVYDYDYDYEYLNNGDLDKLREDAINFVEWIIDKD